MNSQPYHFWAV